MPRFTYKGETAGGTSVIETVDAKDKYAVYDIARTSGHTVQSVTEARRFSLMKYFSMEQINVFLSRISGDDLVMTTRNLSSMLNAGLPLTRALSVIERQSKNLRLKKVMQELHEDINQGKQFHESLEKHNNVFSELYISMVRAGEEGGQLSEALQTLSVQMERTTTLKKKIKGAMIYPAIVISVMVMIGVLMMIYVVPTLTETFKKMDAELPTSTKTIIFISDFLNSYAIVTLGVCIAALVGVIYFSRTNVGKRVFHYILLRIPVIGVIVKEANAARTSRTLSSLLRAGVDVVGSIRITQDVVQNVYFKDVLKDATERVEKGTPMSEIFIEREDLYPVLVGEMISVGEETGQISVMLEELAGFYENEIDQKTKDLSTIIEPILMVVIGTGVGFFALAMITPIYSITDSI